MDNVNVIIDMLKDRLVEATRKTNRIDADMNGDDKFSYTFAELYAAMDLEDCSGDSLNGKAPYCKVPYFMR